MTSRAARGPVPYRAGDRLLGRDAWLLWALVRQHADVALSTHVALDAATSRADLRVATKEAVERWTAVMGPAVRIYRGYEQGRRSWVAEGSVLVCCDDGSPDVRMRVRVTAPVSLIAQPRVADDRDATGRIPIQRDDEIGAPA